MKQLIEQYPVRLLPRAAAGAPAAPAAPRKRTGRDRPIDVEQRCPASPARTGPSRRTSRRASTALVQSPLRAGILRFLSARPDEAFDVEALMQTFGRLRLDVENCVRELRRLRRRAARSPATPPRYVVATPEQTPASRELLDAFLERRADRQHRGPVAVGAALPRDDRPRREDAGRLRVDPHRGQVRHLGADPRADRLGQGSRRADDPRAEPPRHRASSRRSTARRCPTRCSNRRSSATRRARSPARTTASRAGSSWPTTARCSSTRSATCRSSRRPSCCACSRSGASSASAATSRSTSTSG